MFSFQSIQLLLYTCTVWETVTQKRNKRKKL